MTEIIDDKAPVVIPFVLEQLKLFQAGRTRSTQPFFIGLNGVQGAGKSVLVGIIQQILEAEPYRLPTAVFSLDDFYLTHADQVALARSQPENPLLQHRGQPSTHDIPLALSTFRSLKESRPTKIPAYDKAAFNGQGDRLPEAQWKTVNTESRNCIQVVLFEGWCVGFRPLDAFTLSKQHATATARAHNKADSYNGRLGHIAIESIISINEACGRYGAITDQLDAFIHIDAEQPQFVYQWRLEQESNLRKKTGSGMTDAEVKNFVDGYYPAYELYTETLRRGVFKPAHVDAASTDESWAGKQLRLVIGQDRKVQQVIYI